MIQIHQSVLRRQKNFWNNCLFHPTDAVEDPWGRRILDLSFAGMDLPKRRWSSMNGASPRLAFSTAKNVLL